MAWMQQSLTLEDRDMLVYEDAGQVRGFVIAQPWSTPEVGLVDDLTADSWPVAADLLTAAHHAFAARGRRTVQVICPAGWREKSEFLHALGYRTANL